MPNRISVIIQSHNRPKGLKRALFSLQMQTIKNFEVVISDDSDDEGQISNVLNGPAAMGLDIHFRHTVPCGAAESMREACERSRFGYIKILHDDDWLTPRSLECQALALDSNTDTNAVYGRAIICYPHEDKVCYAFAEKAVKLPSSQWVAAYEANGLGPVQSPVTALFRRNPRFRVVWDEFIDPQLREAARRTGAGTDVSLQVDNAGSNKSVILLPYVTCFMGTDMNSCTQTDKNIRSYYEMWKREYDTHPKWRF